MSIDITSASNDRIKWLVRLRERKHRDSEGVFVVEGTRLYRRAVAAGLTPLEIFTDGSVDIDEDAVTVTSSVLDKASYRDRSEGLIAVFKQLDTRLQRILVSDSPLILMCESIEKPGNLGAMMRTAAVAGADAVIAVGDPVDPFNPNAIRASTGALFGLPLAVATWEETGPWLSDRGIDTVAASPEATSSLWDTNLTSGVAIVVGAEDRGLSAQAVSSATKTMRIPQAEGAMDSLNASVAAAVILFEAVRQRKAGVPVDR